MCGSTPEVGHSDDDDDDDDGVVDDGSDTVEK
jgi:hypothetical protein